MDQQLELVPRRAEHLVSQALADTRVVILNGALQTGKSTLARDAAKARCCRDVSVHRQIAGC